MIGRRRRRGERRDAAGSGRRPAVGGADWIGFRPRPETEALLEVLRDRLRTATAEAAGDDGR